MKRFSANGSMTVAALMMVILGLAGCEGDRGPAGPPSPSPIYVAGLISHSNAAYPAGVQLSVFESPSVPTLLVNGLEGQAWVSIYSPYSPFILGLSDSSFQPGDSFHIEVQYQDPASGPARAYADVVLPGSFEITSHDSDLARIPFGDDLELRWSASAGADCYLVDLSFHYSFWDTLGLYHSFWLEMDTLLADTTITFGAERIFPQADLFGGLYPAYSNGSIDLRAESGPWRPGDPGNVHGDGSGIIMGRTFGANLFLSVIE